MQSSTCAFLVISTCVYICLSFTTVYGKCSGRWAIHACYGGNGKRSGPQDASIDSKLNERQYILRQLLLSGRLPQTIATDSELASTPLLDDIDTFYPDVAPSYNRDLDIERVKTMLSGLLLRKRFRDTLADDFDYKR